MREIDEEFDMQASIGDPFAVFTYENQVKGSHTIEVIYFARFIDSLDKISINPEDHSRSDWFTEEEVKEHRIEMVPVDQALHKDGDNDAEYKAVLRGFDLIKGHQVNLG